MRYSCLFLVAFVLLVVSSLLGQVALRLGVGFLVSRAFFGGVLAVFLGVFRIFVALLYFLWVVDLSLG